MLPVEQYAKECYPDQFPEPERTKLYRRWLRYIDKNRGDLSRDQLLRLVGVDTPQRFMFLFSPRRVFSRPWNEETRLVFFWLLCVVGVPAPSLFTGAYLVDHWVGQVTDPQLLGVLASYVHDREGDMIYQEVQCLILLWLARTGYQNGFNTSLLFRDGGIPYVEYRSGELVYGVVYDIELGKVRVFNSAGQLCTLDLSTNFVQDLKGQLFTKTKEDNYEQQTPDIPQE